MTNAASLPAAPGGLRPEEVALLIAELEEGLVGARVDKVIRHSRDGLLFRFSLRTPILSSALSNTRKLQLLFCTRLGFTRFHTIFEPVAAPAEPDEEVRALRNLFSGARVESIDQPGDDRLLRITFAVFENGRPGKRQWVLELFGASGRLLAFDSHNRVIRWVGGRGGFEVGQEYRFPQAKPKGPQQVLSMPFEPAKWIPDEFRGDALAFHQALAASRSDAEQQADALELFQELNRKVRDEKKRHIRLQANLEKDLAGAECWQQQQQAGELLKAELHRLKRGMTEVEVVDYFSSELSSLVIVLRSELSPSENIKRYFNRASKGKRSVTQIEERLQDCLEDLESLQLATVSLASASDCVELGKINKLLAGLHIQRRKRLPKGAKGKSSKTKNRASEQEPKEPKHYRTRQGLEVLVGRSARDNDRLSISLARGNDLFFHRADRPGPHVIMRIPKGQVASPESLEDAAFLAAYMGGWRGPESARVHWTLAKFVRKPKGLPPGKVLISREREFVVKYRPELLSRLVVGSD